MDHTLHIGYAEVVDPPRDSPSAGKSTHTLQIALNVARAGGTVFYCSFEIMKEELVPKLICLRKQIPGEALERSISEDTFVNVTQSCGMLSGLRLFLSCNPMNTDEIMLEAQHIIDTMGTLDLIVIDRLELIKDSPIRGETRALQLGRISQALNNIAMRLDVPLICLVQLSRQSARRGSEESHRPILSDFHDSGAIEQDAKMPIMIHREDQYRPDTKWDGKAKLIIAKNMFGRKGFMRLRFINAIPMFTEEALR